VYVQGHSVTSSASVAGLNGLGLLAAGSSLQMNSGSLGVTGTVTVSYGNLIVQSNATLSHVSPAGYIKISTQANGNDGSMTINGGTVTTDRAVLIGNAAAKNAQGTLTINSGSFSSALQMILGAGTNSTTTVSLNGGNLEMSYLDFANSGTGQTQSLTVNGGALVLTRAAEASAFVFTDPNAKVWFEAGTITFKGVDSLADFNTFTNTFNTWVSNGKVDSIGLTDQNLINGLTFNGTDAVLTVIPEPATLGLFMLSGGFLMVFRHHIRR
jgi:hypothetical protein